MIQISGKLKSPVVNEITGEIKLARFGNVQFMITTTGGVGCQHEFDLAMDNLNTSGTSKKWRCKKCLEVRYTHD